MIRIAERFGLSRRVAATVLLFYLAGVAFESVALGMVMPIFQYIQSDGDLSALAAQWRAWQILIGMYDAGGVPVNLATLMATSFACLIVRQGLYYLRVTYTGRAREDLTRDICTQGFSRYLATTAAYQDVTPRGDVVNDLTTELQRAILGIFYSLNFFGLCLLTAVYLGILFALSWPMTLAALATIGLSFVLLRGQFQRSAATGRRVADANREMSGFLVERLGLARLVRLCGMEAAERERMAALAGRQRNHLVRLVTLMARINVFVEPFVVGIVLVLLYLGVEVLALDLGQMGLFILIVLRLLPVTKELANLRNTVLSYAGSVEALDRRLDEMASAAESKGGGHIFTGLSRRIRFEGVAFHYPGEGSRALDRLTLDIPAGRMTAFVGPSGSGKSTLLDLLPRFREPSAGRILFDDTPVDEFDLDSLRAGIAYAPQISQIFNMTVAEHIRYGRADASEAEIREAARLAVAADFIEALAQGFKTPLGEDGVRLSGGQRQRLDLARALVRRAPILVLDEPTSQLDAEAEAAFREALARIRRETGVTLIVVAHRLSTVMGADRIAVIQDGRLVAVGRHEELLARGGWYTEAFAKQRGPVVANHRRQGTA